MEKQTEQLNTQVKHSGEVLLRLTGLPAKIKRDLHDLLSYPIGQNTPQAAQAIRLLGLYERCVKIITTSSDTSVYQGTNTPDPALLTRLSNELQNLIAELDFEGESGELLIDIRAKLLIGTNASTLIELTLQTLKLVIEGTNYERKTSEQFLDQVNNSLSSSIENFSQNTDQSENYLTQRHDMNLELATLVNKTQSEVENASELKHLQSELDPLIEQLNSVSQRLIDAEQREQALIERMNYNNSQLSALSEITQDYRRRLDDQAKRMLLDQLTKVYNRSAFFDRLELEYRNWIRTQQNLRVTLLDIDNFKAINDSFGYTAGDKALKIIARTIKKELAKTDTIARFGGEEFITLIPENSDIDSFKTIQTIQQQVSKLPFKFKDQNLTITLSAASTSFQETDTPEELIERLSRLLKEGKAKGRSQLIWK